MTRTLLVLSGVLALAGCAKPLEVGSITEIKTQTGAKGIDVYEVKRQAGQASLPEFAGDQLLEVRSYVNGPDGRTEIAGADCDLQAADFSATMKTPARVRVPLYRERSSTLAVSCTQPGFKKRMVTVAAYDVTRSARYASAGNSGLLGVAVVAVVDAASDNSKNEWRYPIARIELEPETPSKVAER